MAKRSSNRAARRSGGSTVVKKKTARAGVKEQPLLIEPAFSFEPRFLEQLVGRRLLRDPRIALTELIANSWDAGARTVRVGWPTEVEPDLHIQDDGIGMTEDQFRARWSKFSYDRRDAQGETIGIKGFGERRVFGRHGLGRFAAFCFGDAYDIETACMGRRVHYRVERVYEGTVPFRLTKLDESPSKRTGTRISVAEPRRTTISDVSIREYLAFRFLTSKSFTLNVNNHRVDLADVSSKSIEHVPLCVDGVADLELLILDPGESDSTTRFKGIVFNVDGRFVGEPSWRVHISDQSVDGRRLRSKRLLIIVRADELREAVTPDWSGFDDSDPRIAPVADAVLAEALRRIERWTEPEKQNSYQRAKDASRDKLRESSLQGRGRWRKFVSQVPEVCPSIREDDLIRLSELLAKLEASESKYGLLSRLAQLDPSDLDALHALLAEWSVEDAKTVLDELRDRLKLLVELDRKTKDPSLDEVRELQPLFERSLWVIGPEFESIEYTSNRTMNSVIRDLIRMPQVKGSGNRPDFVILPDGSVGCYALPRYGRLCEGDTGEIGVDRLVVVELKRAGIPISEAQKAQCWKYVKELLEKGLIDQNTSVQCFSLGTEIDAMEVRPREEMDRRCQIMPLTYSTLIRRAESRLLNLYQQMKSSPFFAEAIEELKAANDDDGSSLFDDDPIRPFDGSVR